jgi:hypothetical protein
MVQVSAETTFRNSGGVQLTEDSTMLKVSGFKPDGQAQVDVDPYVPLTVQLDCS